MSVAPSFGDGCGMHAPHGLRRHLTLAAAVAAMALAGGASAAEAATGALDPTFGSSGVVVTDPGLSQLHGLEVQQDGKVLALDSGSDSASFQRVRRFMPDGQPDSSFSGDGVVDQLVSPSFWVRALGLQPDGKILVAGYDSAQDFVVARLRTDGSLDPEFDGDSGTGNGIVHTPMTPYFDDPKSVIVDNQGRIVVAGTAGSDIGIARYMADGKLDKSLAGDGTLVEVTPAKEYVGGIAAVDDGLVVAGQTGSDTFVARYTEQGAPASGFGTLGRKVIDAAPGDQDGAYGLGVQSDGTIVLGVEVYSSANRLVALTPGGAPDSSFAGGGSVPVDSVINSLALAADDKIVAAGYGTFEGEYAQSILRRNADGTPDPDFGGGATVMNRPPPGIAYDTADFVAVAPDGQLVLGGLGYDPNQQTQKLVLARYQAAPDAPSSPAGDPTTPGTATQTAATAQPAPLALSGLTVTKRRFVAARKRGTAFLFKLNRPARVTIRIKRLHRKATVVRLKRSSRAGGNRVRFSGRVKHHALRPARYRATVRAVDAAGNASNAQTVTFRIVRARAAVAATAARAFNVCGNRPAHLRFNIQAHGVSCTTARTAGRLVNQRIEVIRSHTYEYEAGRWTCRYTVFHSTLAGDGEGEIFDCRQPHTEVRWSNAPGIQPRTIKP
jgi:uncharacterized delta-60 repeat protein